MPRILISAYLYGNNPFVVILLLIDNFNIRLVNPSDSRKQINTDAFLQKNAMCNKKCYYYPVFSEGYGQCRGGFLPTPSFVAIVFLQFQI